MDAKGGINSFVLNKGMDCIAGEPETSIPKLFGWIDAFGIKDFEAQSRAFHTACKARRVVRDLIAKCKDAAANWATMADELRKYSGHLASCKKQMPRVKCYLGR